MASATDATSSNTNAWTDAPSTDGQGARPLKTFLCIPADGERCQKKPPIDLHGGHVRRTGKSGVKVPLGRAVLASLHTSCVAVRRALKLSRTIKRNWGLSDSQLRSRQHLRSRPTSTARSVLEVAAPRRGEGDAECIVAVPFSNPIHGAVDLIAVVKKSELLVVGSDVGKADAEESDGSAACSRVVEEVANHRIEFELRAGRRDRARAHEGFEIRGA